VVLHDFLAQTQPSADCQVSDASWLDYAMWRDHAIPRATLVFSA
jgi:hypothetical protein